MAYHDEVLKQKIRALRQRGYTYTEINAKLERPLSKGTLSYICKDVALGTEQRARIQAIMRDQLAAKRTKAVLANKILLTNKIATYRHSNQNITALMQDRRAKLVALAMLYLGEGSKWQSTRAPTLGSSSPLILRLYISLMQQCYNIPTEAFRARVQHRADQNPQVLVKYWSEVTGIDPDRFYPSYADKRTAGKRTTKTAYKGVCVISCAGTHIQLELSEIAGIIDAALHEGH